jgi:hypothetical protein
MATVRLEGLGKLEKENNDLIGTRTRDLPACSIVPEPTTLRPPQKSVLLKLKFIRALDLSLFTVTSMKNTISGM